MELKIKRLHPEAVMPKYAKPGDAGMDLTAIGREYLDGARQQFFFGLAFEIPEGYVGLIFPRSSIHKTYHRLSNAVGVIDSSYRGEVSAVFDTVDYGDFEYSVGDRVAQMVIVPYAHCNIVEVDELSETERGNGGYGSTGK